PARKIFCCAGLWITLSWKKKKLHVFFDHPDLRDSLPFLIVKHTASEGAEIGELGRDIVMGQPMFHKEKVAERARVGFHRIEHHRVARTRNAQEPSRRRFAWKSTHPFDELEDGNRRDHDNRDAGREDGRIAYLLLPRAPGRRNQRFGIKPLGDARRNWNRP